MDWITTSTLLRNLRDFENEAAWGCFVARFRRPIVSFARKAGLSEDDADDVGQETLAAFADAYRSGRYDREKGRLSRWLFGIAHKQLLRQQRRRRKATPVNASFWEDVAGEDGATATWDLEWEECLLEACLEQVRHEVEPTTFRAFELSMDESRSANEVAAHLDVPVKAVYNAKHRVLKRIRELREELEQVE